MNEIFKKTLITFFTCYSIAGFAAEQSVEPTPSKSPLLQLPEEVIKHELLRQIIEPAESFGQAAQAAQSFAGTNVRIRKLAIDALLKRFNIANPQDAQSQLFELAKSGQGSGLAITALKQAGADINKTDNFGSPALIIAIKNYHDNMARLLISMGANPDLQDTAWGFTPLMEAVAQGNKEITTLLLKAGVDLEKENHSGSTALILASAKGNKEWVEQLINAGANVNKQGGAGATSLMWAAIGNHPTVVAFLLRHGADVTLKNNEMKTALDFARNLRRDPAIIKMLEAREPSPERR